MAANVPERCHHSMRQLHPRCCCGKQCWRKTKQKKKGIVPVSEEEWRAGAALFSWTGTEHIQLLSTEPQQPSCNRFGFLLQRLLDQILQRNNSWETDSLTDEVNLGPLSAPEAWIENAPFTGHDLAVAEPLPFLLFHVNLDICSSEK